MKDKILNPYEGKSLVLVPEEFLNDLMVGQEKILKAISGKTVEKETIGDYITESDAKKMLGRKATWFWNLRKTGKLPFTKVGNKIFYSKAEILSFIEGNKSGGKNG